MKETKFYPLLALSVLFLIVSFVLLCVLGYNFYEQQKSTKPAIAIATPKKTLSIEAEKTRDTLQQLYASAVSSFPPDNGIDSAYKKADSTQTSLMDSKLGDVYKLKTEINSLLKDSSSSTADLELARYKIKELQVKVDDLRTRNVDIEKENRRLRILLEQFAISNSGSAASNRNSVTYERPAAENINSSSSVFNASELKFATANNNDAEVNSADDAEKFIGSLVVKNSLNQGMGEVMLVLIQPDGKVLRNAWESGSFDTDGGKKIYSRKIKFDYNKGESHRINFSVPADNIQKGTYTLQVYSNGKVIGRVAKVVS
jgi:hypothetical protein